MKLPQLVCSSIPSDHPLHLNNAMQNEFAFDPGPTIKMKIWPTENKYLGALLHVGAQRSAATVIKAAATAVLADVHWHFSLAARCDRDWRRKLR